jgi:predicted nucleic acid-binding protein
MIILDNTVLSSLAHIDMLDAPSKLFGEAIIPDGVYYEGVIRAKKSERVAKIKRSIEDGLIKITKPTKSEIEVAEELQKTLGLGERYTIAIGISKKCLVATDDLKPRKVAKVLKLDVIGTLGLQKILKNGFYADYLQWDKAIGEPYTGNPYVRFDKGTEVERPPHTLPNCSILC